MNSIGFGLRFVLVLIFVIYSGISVLAQNGAASSASSSSGASAASASGTSTSSEKEADKLNGYRIVCIYNHKHYYKAFKPSMINPEICTHINYEFASLDPQTYEMISGDEHVDVKERMYEDAIGMKKLNPNLKVVLSLGGWEDSTKKYSELVSAANRVDNFIEKAIDMLKSYGFDGLDVAWEYPNCWKGALGVSPKDKKNFPEFLEKVRKRFDKENLILSVSVASIKREILAAYDGPSVSNAVHFINVMTYDMHGPWDKVTGHHTQLDKMEGDKDPFCNAKGAIQVWLDIGADRKKLNIGLATYAKTFTLEDPQRHGLNAPTKGPGRPGYYTQTSGSLCYYEMCQLLNAGNWTEDQHKFAGFYAYSGDQWASYDPPMMMVKKAEWVVNADLGGVLIKEMSCDDYKGKCTSMPYPLTKMIKMEMIHRIQKQQKGK